MINRLKSQLIASPSRALRILGGVVLAIALILSFVLGRATAPSTSASVNQPNIAPPKATQNVNKQFTFTLKDDKGQDAGKFDYVIQSADITDQILVQGQTATAVKGREFLIINLKLTNNNKQTVHVNTRDYIRLSVNGNDSELLAPDIHNDPVEVQATSTKFTRVGFAINTTDRKLKLIVGEIDGSKTNIDLNLQ